MRADSIGQFENPLYARTNFHSRGHLKVVFSLKGNPLSLSFFGYRGLVHLPESLSPRPSHSRNIPLRHHPHFRRRSPNNSLSIASPASCRAWNGDRNPILCNYQAFFQRFDITTTNYYGFTEIMQASRRPRTDIPLRGIPRCHDTAPVDHSCCCDNISPSYK